MIPPVAQGALHDLLRDRRLGGAEIAQEAARRAAILAPRLSPARRTVMIAHGDTPEFFLDLYAVWLAGGCAACVNPGLARDELTATLALCDAAAVLVDGDDPGALDAPVLRLADERAPSDAAGTPPLDPDAPALLLFTSGTTGAPKAVAHSARGLAARLALNIAHIGRPALARALCPLPTHFGHGLIGNCLTPLAAGGDLHLLRGPGMATAGALGGALDDASISFLSSTPALWRIALRASRPPSGGTLQRAHIGSSPLPAGLWSQTVDWTGGAEVVNMYGMTETANWLAGASSRDGPPEDGRVGRPWGGEAAVRLPDGTVAPAGAGDILVRTPSQMLGYHGRPDLTAAALHRGWYITGDVGEVDAAGEIRLAGRLNDLIDVGGAKISPEQIDLLLERHPDVAECCAFAAPDPISGQAPVAAVRLVPGAAADPAALIAWTRERLRAEAVPRRILLVDDIPKTDRGKLRRGDVARQLLDPAP